MISFQIDKLALNNEYYLAALLSVKEMTEWQERQAIKLATTIDNEKFQKEVIEHRVCGLVMKNIQKLNLFMEKSCEKISKKAKQQVFDSMKLSAELVKVNHKFCEKGICSLLMKGPILANELYGDVTRRTSRDLDILISFKDIDKAIDVLNELGYQTRYSNRYTPKQMANIYRQEHHFDFWNFEGNEIELHWKMSETLEITLEELWENRRERVFAGNRITIPGTIEEMMFLIHHGVGHGFHRMKWLVDIVELIKEECVELEDLFCYALDQKRLNELLAGILLCHAMEAFDMPDIELEELSIRTRGKSIIVDIHQDGNKQLKKEVESSIKLLNAMKPVVCNENGKRDYAVDSKEYINYYHTYVKEMDCFQGKKRIWRLWERLQPGERDFNIVQLKDEFFVLYYFIRPIYWIYLVAKRGKYR